MNELIVPLGRDINPRFSSSGKTTRIVKSSSFHVEKPADKTESESSLVKSSTFESLFEVGSGVPDLESEIKKATQDSTNPIESASSTPLALEDSPAMEVGLETVHHCHKLGWTEEYAVNGGHDVTFSKTYSTQGEKHEATVNTPAYNDNQRLTGESVTPTYHEDNNADTFGEYHPDDTAPSHSRHDEGDLRVVDFEVTNSETETTVVLKHLLALSSLSKEKETNEATDNNGNGTNSHVRRSTGSSSLWTMPSIEESDSEESESYYESEEVVTTPPLPIVPYTLPIPTINLQDEDGTVLETILQGTEGLKSEEDGTDATCTVDGGNGLVANYSPKTVYDDELGPSTKL